MEAIIKFLVVFFVAVLLCLEGEDIKRSIAARKIIALAIAILLLIFALCLFTKKSEVNKKQQNKQSFVYPRALMF